MEEFEESDVLFFENPQQEKKNEPKSSSNMVNSYRTDLRLRRNNREEEEKKKKKKKKMMMMVSSSVPVRIPEILPGNSILNGIESTTTTTTTDIDYDIFEEEINKEEMVPPHLMVDRMSRPGIGNSRRMAFSVCIGNGRTLKGRDLSQVRNSVLRMTGFIETC